jgi:hypothetical protein
MLLRKYFRKYLRRYKLDMGGALAGLTEGPRGLQLHVYSYKSRTCIQYTTTRTAVHVQLRVALAYFIGLLVLYTYVYGCTCTAVHI